MRRKITYIIISVCMLLVIGGCSEKEVAPVIKDKNIVGKEDNKQEQYNKSKEEKVDNREENGVEEENIEKEIIEVKTIVIDPGHSSVGNFEKEQISPDSIKMKPKDVLGATGDYTKVPEYKTTVSIGSLLKEELESKGYNVIMTKTEESESLSNIDRATIANESKADLVVRIHADSSEDHSVKGASALIPVKNQYTDNICEASKNYGEQIINTYTNELNIKNRGTISRDDMTGFNWSKVPVVILEMGFLSNKEEDNFISNTENHERIAKAISKGIYKCFE